MIESLKMELRQSILVNKDSLNEMTPMQSKVDIKKEDVVDKPQSEFKVLTEGFISDLAKSITMINDLKE